MQTTAFDGPRTEIALGAPPARWSCWLLLASLQRRNGDSTPARRRRSARSNRLLRRQHQFRHSRQCHQRSDQSGLRADQCRIPGRVDAARSPSSSSRPARRRPRSPPASRRPRQQLLGVGRAGQHSPDHHRGGAESMPRCPAGQVAAGLRAHGRRRRAPSISSSPRPTAALPPSALADGAGLRRRRRQRVADPAHAGQRRLPHPRHRQRRHDAHHRLRFRSRDAGRGRQPGAGRRAGYRLGRRLQPCSAWAPTAPC